MQHAADPDMPRGGRSSHDEGPRMMPAGRVAALALAFLSGGAATLVFQLAPRLGAVPEQPISSSVTKSDSIRPVAEAPAVAPPVGAEAFEQETVETTPPAPDLGRPPVAVGYRGVLEPAAGAFVKLPLATSQPVAFVDVRPGDRVEKGWQVFSHWESPERLHAMKNELDKAKKQLELAKIRAATADQTLGRLEKLGANVSSQELQDGQAAAALRKGEVEAAELAVTETQNRYVAMEFEFKQAFVTSPIEGVVASVDIVQGERRQVGGAFRGVTVLDPKQLSCRGAVPPQVASRLRKDLLAAPVSATIECLDERRDATLAAVGVMADPTTGLIPIWLEVPNEDESLFCGAQAVIRFNKPTESRP